ncbi:MULTISPECIES: Beta-galactosidase C-terminal domain [Paraburkholderia]|uniref:Beta-galactosidase C-terminal domain n=1 Tax=Paraburkholderia TaxID=1822464 RepID=UPI0032184731
MSGDQALQHADCPLSPYAGRAAITQNVYGRGVVHYIGSVLDEDSSRLLLRRIVSEAGIDCWLDLPDGVEVAVRRSGDRRITFVLNLSSQTKHVSIQGGDYVSALSDRRFTGGNLELEPGGVEIVAEATGAAAIRV